MYHIETRKSTIILLTQTGSTNLRNQFTFCESRASAVGPSQNTARRRFDIQALRYHALRRPVPRLLGRGADANPRWQAGQRNAGSWPDAHPGDHDKFCRHPGDQRAVHVFPTRKGTPYSERIRHESGEHPQTSVAKSESIPLRPILAKIAVSAAKHAESTAQANQLEASAMGMANGSGC